MPSNRGQKPNISSFNIIPQNHRFGDGEGMNKTEINETLQDYTIYISEIKRIKGILGDAGEGLVKPYEDADMPRGKGSVGDPVYLEVAKRERYVKRLEGLKAKVQYVQNRVEWITDEKERTVLDCMLEGMSLAAIGNHMGLSPGHVWKLKENIVEQMCEHEKTPA